VGGTYVELQSLIGLQYKASGFSFLPRQPIHSLFFGRHSSRVRGRGLDFEELRAYQPGDDIRTIDWHVTARMQKPFVRVFTEERDRPAVIALDQRINMFFGSRVSTKSVSAAEVAALGAWRVFHQGDRIGALIFNDTDIEEIKPHRSRTTVLRILEQTAEQNHCLSAGSPARSNPGMLNEIVRRVSRVAMHDFTVLLISDFSGADDVTDHLLLRLAQHNDVIAAFVYDPLAVKLPASGDPGGERWGIASGTAIRPRSCSQEPAGCLRRAHSEYSFLAAQAEYSRSSHQHGRRYGRPDPSPFGPGSSKEETHVKSDTLDKLHDFYQLPPPSCMPQTMGWYAALAILVLILNK
jgi:uncharacterized protein (DUF58 family)